MAKLSAAQQKLLCKIVAIGGRVAIVNGQFATARVLIERGLIVDVTEENDRTQHCAATT